MNMKTQKLLYEVNAILGQARTDRKFLAVLLAAIVLLNLLPMVVFAAIGDTGTTADGFKWEETGSSGAEITGYTGTDTAITIPDTIDNNGTSLTVWYIGSYAFFGKKTISAVTIPESVMEIGMRAFYECTALTSINIPAAVNYIDEQAFDKCTSLAAVTFGADSSLEFIGGGAFSETAITSINIPDGVNTISEGAFDGCSVLTSINIPDGVTSIRNETFRGCSALTSIDIPAGVTSFGFNVFDGCAALTSINIPSNVESIGYNAFRGCASLASITIPSGVTSIQNETFSGCTNLAAVNFAAGTSLNAIGSSAFQGCTTLPSITIPDGVGSIGISAFQGCTNLATVNIDADISALNTIGNSAFQGCAALTSITIPEYVSTIGDSAFSGCTSLESANFVDLSYQNKTIGSSAFQGCTALTSVNIPRWVSSIGSSAFNGCTNLATVNFTSDSELTSIGDSAFQGCTALTSVNIPANVTNIGSSAFQACTSLVKATVKSKNATFDSNVFDGAALGSDGVYGYKNSTADTYCKANSIPFHYLTDGETVITTTSLPNGTINMPYSQTLARIGDAASITWSIDSGSLPDGLSLDAGAGVISGTPTALGSYTFTVKAVNSSDAGDSDTQELTITISKRTPTVAELTYNLTARTYNGLAQPLTMTGAAGLGTITVKYDGNDTAPTNAGTYTVTVDIEESTDYSPATGISLGDYTINKAELTISGGSVAAKTYDGTTAANVTALTFNGLQNSESLTIITDYTVSNTHFNSADAGADKTVTGTAALVSTGTTAKNYTLTNTSLSLTGQTIGKADFTVPNVNKLVTYTDTGSQTVDIAVLVADKKLSGDTLIYQAGNVTGANPTIIQSKSTDAAGTLNFTISGGTVGDTATISVTVSGFTNYNDVTVNVVVTLTDKIPVTVNLPAPDKTYDGNPAAASANASGIPDGDFNYIWLDSNGSQLAGNIPPTNAGSYQVMAEISGNSALTFIGEAAISFTIARKTITVRADDKSVTRAGVLPALTVSYSGFVGTDSATNALTTQAVVRLGVTNSNTVGTSAIDFENQAVLNNTIGANYTLSHVNGTLTITRRGSGDPDGGGATPTSRYEASVSGSSGSVKIEIKVDKNNASAELSLAQTAKGKDISVTMPKIPGVTSYTLGIPIISLSRDDGNGSITLNTDAGNITLPSDMLTGTEAASGNKVQVSIGIVKPDDLPKDVQDKVGNRPIISLSISIDSKTVAWENSNAPVTVSIPYTPTAEELRSPEGITIWFIDGSGKLAEVSGARYDSATGMVVFQTTHFSYYAVGYNVPATSFSDVLPGAWYYDAVTFIAAKGITTGTGGGKFSPEVTLTRGQFIVMLMKAYDIEVEKNPLDNFSDAGDTYYTGYLAAAKRLGISAGVGNNLYAPDKEITRQEMFTLLYNALKVIGQQPGTHGRAVSEADDQPQGDSGKKLSDFSDVGQIDSWAKDAMTLLVEAGTISGSGGKLNPTSAATRAEMAQVLYNLLSK